MFLVPLTIVENNKQHWVVTVTASASVLPYLQEREADTYGAQLYPLAYSSDDYIIFIIYYFLVIPLW